MHSRVHVLPGILWPSVESSVVNRSAKAIAAFRREGQAKRMACKACAKKRSGTVKTAAEFARAELAASPGRRKPQAGGQIQ